MDRLEYYSVKIESTIMSDEGNVNDHPQMKEGNLRMCDIVQFQNIIFCSGKTMKILLKSVIAESLGVRIRHHILVFNK